ncbi:MAG: oxidative damage protection protein [Thermomicrobiales bacterium]|jgi:Fe-S cluster biosynthesis and repair protein YggX|nr:oxidative damage protection protein [Thermomicrobiales bacterium]
MARMVHCVKLGRELEGLEKPPFPGELGQRIYDNVSQEAWRQWQSQLTIMINHYGLNLLDPATREMLDQQMEEFFFGEQPEMPEGWVPGSQGKGGAPSAKGGAPAARK